MSMANEPDVPAQLYRTLHERLQNSDKEGAIELYYELLSSGHSVGEILNGVGPVRSKSEYGDTATTEQPQSGRHGADAMGQDPIGSRPTSSATGLPRSRWRGWRRQMHPIPAA
jgi:hypothetical protein